MINSRVLASFQVKWSVSCSFCTSYHFDLYLYGIKLWSLPLHFTFKSFFRYWVFKPYYLTVCDSRVINTEICSFGHYCLMIISVSKCLCRCQFFAVISTYFWPLKSCVSAVGRFAYSLKIFDIPEIRFLL